MKKQKKIPQFKSEAEETAFWATHEATDYIDFSRTRRSVFPNLRPSTKTISTRLPDTKLHSKIEQGDQEDSDGGVQ